MTRSLSGRARPAMFLLTLLVTVACTSAPAAAQSPTSGPVGTVSNPTAPADPSVSNPGTGGGGGNSGPGNGGLGNSGPGQAGGSGPIVVQPSGPDTPIGGGVGPVDPNPLDPDAGWQPIGVTPGLDDPHAQPWDHIKVAPDGKTVTIYFWGGVNTCYGLAEVRVTRQAGVATITVITGSKLPAGTACIEIAAAYRTTITLDEPLVLDGAQTGQE